MIGVIDIGTGNLRSVLEALRRVGAPAMPVRNERELEQVRGMLLPGVGAFGEGMRALHAQELVDPIRSAVNRGVPLLGICLGMQLLAEIGYEHGRCEGLGLIAGEVLPLEAGVHCARVPNMGWRAIDVHRNGALLDASCRREHFFFAHSFHLVAARRDDVVSTMPGGAVASVEHENVYGAQFHPEKSQDAGLNMLARFAAIVQPEGGVKRASAA